MVHEYTGAERSRVAQQNMGLIPRFQTVRVATRRSVRRSGLTNGFLVLMCTAEQCRKLVASRCTALVTCGDSHSRVLLPYTSRSITILYCSAYAVKPRRLADSEPLVRKEWHKHRAGDFKQFLRQFEIVSVCEDVKDKKFPCDCYICSSCRLCSPCISPVLLRSPRFTVNTCDSTRLFGVIVTWSACDIHCKPPNRFRSERAKTN